MENVNIAKENLCVNKIIGQKNENFYVEEDSIIPDIKPDILNAISTSGNVCIYKKEVLDGKVKIEGTVNVYIMYLADSENDTVRGVNTNIDFTHILDIDNCKNNMSLDEKITIKTIECKVLNGRKINIKVALELETSIYSNDNVELITSVNDIEDVQMLKEKMTINSLLGQGCAKAYAKDTIIIDDTDTVAEILKCDLNIINKEIKISYNKILAKADAQIKLMYLTEENSIKCKETMIPVMGFIDIQNITEDNLCDMNYSLANIIVKPNSQEEHSIYVEAEVNLSCMVYENKQVEIIQDLYCPSKELEFNKKEVKTMLNKTNQKQVCNVRQKISMPEIEGHQLYNVDVNPVINKAQIIGQKIVYEGDIGLNFVYSSDNISRIDTKMQHIPFDFTVEMSQIDKEWSIKTNVEVIMQDFIVLSEGDIDIKIDLVFDIGISNTAKINIINEILVNEENNQNPYSMTIYFVKKNDTLWKIAKKFKSTVEDIVRVNNIEDENKIYPGQQLFIPKYVARKIGA